MSRLPRFVLDAPTEDTLLPITRFGGWYVPQKPGCAKLSLHVNGKPAFALTHGSLRPDVQAAMGNLPGSAESGFFGELVVDGALARAGKARVEIVDGFEGAASKVLAGRNFKISGAAESLRRKREFDLGGLLACPLCGGLMTLGADRVRCVACGGAHRMILGAPHFHAAGELPLVRASERDRTHPYGSNATRLLDEFAGRMILDFGAGNTPVEYLRPNVVYLDVQQFQHTDVVATLPKLPFKDGQFDLVVSQAVFEHVPDPHATARELHRVLKPGGVIYIETAFMQPLHGDPSHYFNMTRHGLRKVMAGFEEVDSGIAVHQQPSFGLVMQIEQVLPHVTPGRWGDWLNEMLQTLRAGQGEFDAALGARGREILAAGVYFQGRKTAR
jgi:hypothetical protein